jgi:tetratricopeptide (TPR) repeat protein
MAHPSKKKLRPPEVDQGEASGMKEMRPGNLEVLPWRFIFQVLTIAAAVLWIYQPALRGDWLWDDDVAITANSITQSPTGLWSIWFEPGRELDYYPVVASVQWIQWHLWGMDTLGYHVTNVFLHFVGALLVWRLLSKFKLRFAWLGGLIFAIHPVQVESVAWIAELKNTLSLPPILLAMCVWIDFDERGKPKDYWLALGLFLVAMLCKLSVILFPLVILLYAWWRRGRIGWKDLKLSAPFFGVSLVLALITIGSGIWEQRFNHTDPSAIPVGGLLARLDAAGLSLSFYFSKSFLPVNLLPIYPKWTVDPSSPIQFLPWLVLGGVMWWLWTKRHGWGRHVLLGLGFFLINLAPCPGFIPDPTNDMAFAWVVDHFLYLPIIGLIGLTVAALGQIGNQLPAPFRACSIGLLAVIMTLLTLESHRHAKIFVNAETLWGYTLRHNPEAWLAHNNLGDVLLEKDRLPEAMEQFEEALRVNPDYAEAHSNLGNALLQTGQLPEAMEQFEEALRIKPDYADAHYNLGNTLLKTGRLPDAMEQFGLALQIKPDYAEAHNNLGFALFQTGRVPEAMEHYEQALRIDSHNASAHYNLGLALLQTGQLPEAREQFEQALEIKPDDAGTHNNLGSVLWKLGERSEAIEQFEQSLQINPRDAGTHYNLGYALERSGRVQEAMEQFEEALQIQPDFTAARNKLAHLQAIQKAAPAKN